MSVVFLLPILFSFGLSEEAFDCTYPGYRKGCRSGGRIDGFPEAKEHLDEVCAYLIGEQECELRRKENCESEESNLEELPRMREVLDSMKEMCDENSLVYAAIVDKLSCLKSAIPYLGHCYKKKSHYVGLLEAHNESLIAEGISAFIDDNDMCLLGLHMIACELLQVENRCGTVAMEGVMEIFRRTSYLYIEVCNEEIKDYLPAVFRIVKEGGEEAEELEEVFEVFK